MERIPIPIPKNFIEEKITINRLRYTSNGTEKNKIHYTVNFNTIRGSTVL